MKITLEKIINIGLGAVLTLGLAPTFTSAAGDAGRARLVPGRDGVTRPQKVKNALPGYPLSAQRRRVEGTVALQYVVLADGTVGEVEVTESTNPGHGFEEAAVKAVRRWRFAPGMLDGRPVDVLLEVTVQFSPEELLEQRRWQRVEEGLRALAEAEVFSDGALVAGKNGVSWPVAVKQRSPAYPHGARLHRITSRVILLVLISDSGEVVEIPLAHAQQTDYPFKKAALDAVQRWRFQPATKDGRAVSAYHWIRIRIPSESR
jgi:TonB family protein